MKNKIIGRKYKEFITPEYYRLEIIDKAYYVFVIALIYSALAFCALYSLSERGYLERETSLILSLICWFLICVGYWPIFRERYIQMDKNCIVISSGISYSPDLRTIDWEDVVELYKIRSYHRGKNSSIMTLEMYKFIFRDNSFAEIPYFDSANLESQLVKFSTMNKIKMQKKTIKPSIFA